MPQAYAIARLRLTVIKPYFQSALPRLFAHRGFTIAADGSSIDENTLEAFQLAVDAGADYIETDLQCTKDGVAIIFHDDYLSRSCPEARLSNGRSPRVFDLTLKELQAIQLVHGARIPTLEQVLQEFPKTRFNLDFKTTKVVEPGVQVLIASNALNRVLVSAFSERRRKRIVSRLPDSVATSAGSALVILVWLASRVGLSALVAKRLQSVDALQIPTKQFGVRFATKRFVDFVHSFDVEVHFWTINDSTVMRRLFDLGADGIVTDQIDAAVALRNASH
jgi:glycerophosphoryl diester phosphodiesterase